MSSGPASRAIRATSAVISCSPWPRVATENGLTIGARLERRDRGQRLAFEELEERAAGGRDVVDAALQAELVDRGGRVAPACARERVRLGDGAADGVRAPGEGVELEHAERAVPDDGAGRLEALA